LFALPPSSVFDGDGDGERVGERVADALAGIDVDGLGAAETALAAAALADGEPDADGHPDADADPVADAAAVVDGAT